MHHIAQDINPDARVVYVDNDPMVLAHSRALKTGGNTVVIEADLRQPQFILDHPATRALIDFTRPLAVLLVAVLHFISDDDQPRAIVSAIRDTLPTGSYLVLSHVTSDIRPEVAAKSETEYKKVTPGATLRAHDTIAHFFTGLDLLDPGLVPVLRWRPDEPGPPGADKVWFLGGVRPSTPATALSADGDCPHLSGSSGFAGLGRR